ncbi:hypothetical protein DXG01_011269 [Tephrocybe rancida]|nr:hypothetical protein DXG01_011269 [Tephrocybe rancida]
MKNQHGLLSLFPHPDSFKEREIVSTKKYYAIVSGRKLGIFSDWIEVGPYVRDKGVLQQGFNTFPEALHKYSGIHYDNQYGKEQAIKTEWEQQELKSL